MEWDIKCLMSSIAHNRLRSSKFSGNSVEASPRHGRAARLPIYRMMQIHELLKERKFPNCQDLSKEMEVSYKTIQRDIDFMRDQLQLPIDYDTVRHGFHYTREVRNLPAVALQEGEIVALLVAQKAAEQIAAGQLVFDIDVMPPPPAERITFEAFIDVTLLQQLGQTSPITAAAGATS